MKNILLFITFWACIGVLQAQERFSAAGFYSVPNSGREVLDFNPGWRFQRELVNLPHTVQLVPSEASGSRNYQGPAWYSKNFVVDTKYRGKRLSLYFEAVMGKSSFYVNGKKVKEHFGGFLPVSIDLTAAGVCPGEEVTVAVCADNSDDPSFPPGRKQYTMDFCVFGGIYRDCYLVITDDVHVSDANEAGQVAGGGVFISYEEVSEKSARLNVKTHIANDGKAACKVELESILLDAEDRRVAGARKSLRLPAGSAGHVTQQLSVKNPSLWHPDTPSLYRLKTSVYRNGKLCDAVVSRIGIRSVEFRGAEGLYINGKPFEDKLMGVNRHQDYAYIGNAVPNNLHWLDVKKMRDAGFRIIRSAHYPQDPAFMDACDELGMFVIVATPGWQYWNPAPEFEERVLSDIRNMVRRDRNHPSVLLWEPVLNETAFPESFAQNAYRATHEEYPAPGCYAAIDDKSKGAMGYDVLYTAPKNEAFYRNSGKSCFTREYGDCVDDWNSHNSYSRVAREWGEGPQIRQAQHYARKDYGGSLTVDQFYKSPRGHVGGALWHSFDHQRGYHPDPFYGGVMDVFRQPKYAYYMFKAQRSPEKQDRLFETGPMVYIAHEMTPFSPKDVTVYSNCDEVRLTYNKGGKTWTYTKPATKEGMPSPVITFKDIYDFMIDKNMSMRKKKQDEVFLLAEGIIDGKVVATHEVRPARRPEKVLLWVDNENTDLKADGSDFVTVVAAIADKNGNIKRLNNYYVKFHVEGEGRILGGANILANPAPVKWGTAPVLIQSTLKPGKIKITASVLFEGSQMPASAVLELESKPAAHPLIYTESEAALISMNSDSPFGQSAAKSASELEQERLLKERNAQKLKEVEKQQADFGEKK